ncbi:MAG: diguanylate cyclase, partial [Eubacteriales bacterium]
MFDINTAVVDEEDKKQGFDISTAVIEDFASPAEQLPPPEIDTTPLNILPNVGEEPPPPQQPQATAIGPTSYSAPDFGIKPIGPVQPYEMLPKLPEDQYTPSPEQVAGVYATQPVTGIPAEREIASSTEVPGVPKVASMEISPQYSKVTNQVHKMVSSKETNPKKYADILKDVPVPDRDKIIKLLPPEIQDSTRKNTEEFAGAAPATGAALKTAAAATGAAGKMVYPIVNPYNDKYFQNKFGREIIGADKTTQEPATPEALKSLTDKYRREDGTISIEMVKDESPVVKGFLDAAKRYEENPNKQKPFVEAKENLIKIADILDPWEMKEYKITERIAQLKKKGGNEYGKAFERGDLSFVISQAIADAAIANNPEQAQQAIALRTQYNNAAGRSPEEKKGILKELALATVEMLAPMIVTGVKGSVPIVGQLWSGYEWSRQGMGDTYADMIEAGVSNDNARKIAAVGGVIYAQVENMEIAQLKKIIGKEAMGNSIRSMILNIVKTKGVDWAKEVGEEGFQRLTTDIATEIGKGTIEGAPKEALTKKVGRLLTNMGQEMAAAAGPMGVLTLFGIGGNLVKQAAQREAKDAAPAITLWDDENNQPIVSETPLPKTPTTPQEVNLPPDITIGDVVNKIENGENVVIEQPTKGAQDAEQVQGDQGQPDIAGDVGEVSKDQGGEDLQQPEETRGAEVKQQTPEQIKENDGDIVEVFKKTLEKEGTDAGISEDKAVEEISKLTETSKKVIRDHIKELSSVKEASQIDGLTGLKNRIWAKDQGLTREIIGDKGKKIDIPADIPQAHIDIDHFKKVNDDFGHQVGDEVLNNIGIILNEEFEKAGTPTRWGGEEFVTFPLTGIDKKTILDSIERTRKRLLESTFDDGRLTNINISAGFGESYKQADDALYIAKQKRGRTVDYADQEQTKPDTEGEPRVRVEPDDKESDTPTEKQEQPATEQKPVEKQPETEAEQPGPTDETDIENHPDPEVRFSGKEGSIGKPIEGWLKPSVNNALPNSSYLVIGNTGDLTDGHLLFAAGKIPPSYQKRFDALWEKKKKAGKTEDLRENVNTAAVIPEGEGIPLQHRKNIQFEKKNASAYTTPDGRTVSIETETVSYLNKEFPGHTLKSTGDDKYGKLEVRPVKIYNKAGEFVGIVMPLRFNESFKGINWDYKKAAEQPAATEKKAPAKRRRVKKLQPFPYKKRDYSIKEITERSDGNYEFKLNEMVNGEKREKIETGPKAALEEKYGITIDESALPKTRTKKTVRKKNEDMSYDEAGTYALSLPETIKINTPERDALRNEIADKLYGTGAKKKEHKAVIIIGLPASGKSTIAEKSFDLDNYLLIDSDEVKKLLPEYDNGLGANAVHEESALILEDLLIPRAIEAGDNFVLPVLGKTKKTIFDKIDFLKSSGYTVRVIHVKVPAAVSLKRLEDRWEKTHRWVTKTDLESKQQKIEANAKELSSREDIEYEEWEGENGTRIDTRPETGGIRKTNGRERGILPVSSTEENVAKEEEGGIDVSTDTGDNRSAVERGTAGIRAGDEAEGEMGGADRTGDNLGIQTDEITDGQRSDDATGTSGGTSVSGYISSAADGGGAGARGDEPANTAIPGAKSERRFIDYLIDSADEIGQGGPAQKLKDNLEAIRTLKAIEKEGRYATPAEQRILVKYVGWGGLSNVFKSSDKSYQEIKDLLTKEEYQTAIHSTLNAHYTSPMVIQNVWNAVLRLGFNGGNVLEPGMGIGHFFGLRPTATKMAMSGIELDSITGRIAKQLYQNAIIKVQGYETHKMPKDYYNLIISNVPFLEEKYSPTETPAAKTPGINKRYALHDFYFLKSLYGLRPGGIIAFVTSRYTMDKKDSEIRKLITNQADFLGAIRLPSSAFKKNAGTEVVTDVIFLQKRFPNGEQSSMNESFVNVGSVAFPRVKDEYVKE